MPIGTSLRLTLLLIIVDRYHGCGRSAPNGRRLLPDEYCAGFSCYSRLCLVHQHLWWIYRHAKDAGHVQKVRKVLVKCRISFGNLFSRKKEQRICGFVSSHLKCILGRVDVFVSSSFTVFEIMFMRTHPVLRHVS